MAKKISQLTAASTLTGSELIPIVQGGVNMSATPTLIAGASGKYFSHGFAGNQILGDPKFYDLSGAGNNGAFGANLSNANAWANAGYVSTVAPGAGVTDSVIRFPSLNLDYNGGEKLIYWWLGKVTPGGSAQQWLGDGFNATYHGTYLRVNTAGTMQLVAVDGSASNFSGTSTGVPFDGTLHSLAIVLDGAAKKYGMWVDEVYDSALGGVYATLSGNAIDTRTSNTFNIGQSLPASANSTIGLASQTRAFVAFHLPSAVSTPSVSTLTSIFQQLRANPGKRVLASAF